MKVIVERSGISLQWKHAPCQPWLGVDDVHLWRARLGDGCPMPLLRETLSVQEALCAERIPERADRRQFIASRGWLRVMLGCYLQIAPEEVRLTEDGLGRTSLAPPNDDIEFDLSLSGDLTLIAVSRARRVGIDVERVHENLPFAEMATHYFEPEQTWGIVTARGEQRASNFFREWTAHEAVRRLGTSFPRAFPGHVALSHLSPALGFTAALAVDSREYRLACWDWR